MLTSRMKECASAMNAIFQYISDEEKYGVKEFWIILNGRKIEGDCEDYSLALLRMLEKSTFNSLKALWTGKANMHYVTYNGEGHAMLEYNKYWIDNIQKEWKGKYSIFDGKHYVYGKRYTFPAILMKLLGAKLWGTFMLH